MVTLQHISFNLLDIVSIFAVYLMASIYVGATFFCKRMPYFVGYTYLCISISALLINFITAKGLYGDVNKFFHHWGVIGVVGTMVVLMFVFFKNPKEKEARWNDYYYDARREQFNSQSRNLKQEQQFKEQASRNDYFDKQKYQQQKADQYLYEQLKENRDREIDRNDIYKAESKGGVYQQQQTENNNCFNQADNRNFNSSEFNSNYNNNACPNNYNDNNMNYNSYYNNNNNNNYQTNCNMNGGANNTNNQQLSVNESFEKDILSKTQDMLYNFQYPVKQDVDKLKNDITVIHNDVQKIVDKIAQLFSLISLVLKK